MRLAQAAISAALAASITFGGAEELQRFLGFTESPSSDLEQQPAQLDQEVSISCVYHDQSHSMNPALHSFGVALMAVKRRALDTLNGERR